MPVKAIYLILTSSYIQLFIVLCILILPLVDTVTHPVSELEGISHDCCCSVTVRVHVIQIYFSVLNQLCTIVVRRLTDDFLDFMRTGRILYSNLVVFEERKSETSLLICYLIGYILILIILNFLLLLQVEDYILLDL